MNKTTAQPMSHLWIKEYPTSKIDLKSESPDLYKRINVTKSFLPPIEDYIPYLERIWESSQLTNNGPLVRELEVKLKEHLKVEHLYFVSNGTIGLQLAIKSMNLHGEIITTPFSYVATTTSILWEGCRPIFVDIDPETLCLNPNLIEEAISPKTTAILATHVYGYPCNLKHIEDIARRHSLKIIYDGAHAFGSRLNGGSLLAHGDISVCSFHATKLFHTVEGGCMIVRDDEVAKTVSLMRSFGHMGEDDYYCAGINGKNSEFHAAMGLAILPRVELIISRRKALSEIYDRELKQGDFTLPRRSKDLEYNYAYYPVLFQSEAQLLGIREILNRNHIYPRRYFYPSLNQLPYCWGRSCPVSENISRRVLCLPLYPEMDETMIKMIARLILPPMDK